MEPLNHASPKPPGDKIEAEFGEKTGRLTTESLKIRTQEDALRVSKIDLTVWKVAKCKLNSWEVTISGKRSSTKNDQTYTNYQVTLELVRIVPTIMELAMERLLARMVKRSVKVKPIVRDSTHGRYLLEISLQDSHFSLLAWNRETGDNYDLKHAEEDYLTTVEDLLGKTEGCKPERILFVFGNDFLHINNPEGVTPRGHNVLDVDGRLCKVIEVAERAVIKAVARCAQVAPVDVLWVPGNHDPETSYFLCRILKAQFHQNPNIHVNVEPPPRKYYRYGVNLLGFTHGNEEKHSDLPSIMASERRRDWSECKHFEVHLGHFHKKKETRYSAGDTFGGVQVKVLPSISGTDSWHFKKGYVKGNRMAEAFLFDHDRGPVATYTSFNLRHKKT